jgi:hypothetical protein
MMQSSNKQSLSDNTKDFFLDIIALNIYFDPNFKSNKTVFTQNIPDTMKNIQQTIDQGIAHDPCRIMEHGYYPKERIATRTPLEYVIELFLLSYADLLKDYEREKIDACQQKLPNLSTNVQGPDQSFFKDMTSDRAKNKYQIKNFY